MLKSLSLTTLFLFLLAAFAAPVPVLAQDDDPLAGLEMPDGYDPTGPMGPGGPGNRGGGEFAQARKAMQEQRKAEQEKMKAQREEMKSTRQAIQKLVQEYRAADEAARPAVKERIRAALKDAQAKLAAGLTERLELMKQRQAKLEEQIKKVETEGDRMIEERLERMCANADRKGPGKRGKEGKGPKGGLR